MKFTSCRVFVLISSLLFTAPFCFAKQGDPILLWPEGAPGETNKVNGEHDTSAPGKGLVAGKPVVRIGDVTQPAITIYQPPASKNTGTAVVICPGGGYNILAYDLEGTEVCEWLTAKGVTAVLLKYRVPRKDGAPLQDAQRALGLVRHRAAEFGIDPHRIGVFGFSAGGNLAAKLCANYDHRTYPTNDAADNVSCRPDFQILLYPAYLASTNAPGQLVPEVAVTTNNPPAFIVMTMNDPIRVDNAFAYAHALKEAKVPVELHLYATGGHGYGLRKTKEPVTGWPELAEKWLETRGLLKSP